MDCRKRPPDQEKEATTTARRRQSRLFLAITLVMGVLFAVPVQADTESDLKNAKDRFPVMQARLDAATARWYEAENRWDQTRGEIERTKASIAQRERRIEAARERLAARARIAYMSGGPQGLQVLLSSGSFTEFSDRLEFLGNVAASDSDLVVDISVETEELRQERERLAELSDEQRATTARMAEARKAFDVQVGAIQAEIDRLTEKLMRERKLAREAAEERARQEVLGQPPAPDGNPSPKSQSSGAIQVCPVAGPNSFVDSFGWPRSGGRTHQGIDLMAAFGTPVAATHSGVVQRGSSSLGGITAWVVAPGHATYYAHMSSYGASGNVSAGTVIGYVGSTGNAGTTNHLHFELHPGGTGAAAVNPYSMLRAVC